MELFNKSLKKTVSNIDIEPVFIWKKVGDYVEVTGNQNRVVSMIQRRISYDDLKKSYHKYLSEIKLEIEG